MRRQTGGRRESGQAAVEAALTMPLAVFLVLGTLQLFMMLQGRILAEYAVFRATRAGSVNQGDCQAMTHAALGSVLPAVTRTDDMGHLIAAFTLRKGNKYMPAFDGMRTGPIVWIQRRTDRNVPADIVEGFDDRTRADSRIDLQVDMVFWYPLRIPFANWVMARMFLAYWGLAPYLNENPLMPAQNARWTKTKKILYSKVGSEMRKRVLMGQYVAPIVASHRMRMMTPAIKIRNACPNSPSSL